MTGSLPRGDSESPQYNDDQHNGPLHYGAHYEGTHSHSSQYTGDGHVHVSGGNQVNIHQSHNALFPTALAQTMLRRAAAPWPMNRASLDRLQGLFVYPERYERARQTLKANSTVVITGEPGSGRRSAAMMMLFKSSSSWHELPSELDEDETPLDLDSVDEHAGLLLDLSSYPPEVVQSMLARWAPFQAKVVEKQCRLALVLSSDAEHLLGNDLLPHVVKIGRPDGRKVLENHLATESVEFTDSDLDSADVQARLRTERMSELARLSLLVREAKSATEEGGFANWLSQALQAFSHRAEHVATWLRKHTDGRDRALILTAAMLEGTSTDAIHAASIKLLKIVQFPDDDTHILEQAGIAERLSKLELRVDDQGSVRFDGLNFDQQVRTHFWAEYPRLRGKLRQWIGNIAQLDELDEKSRNSLVIRFAEQCLATNCPDDLRSVTEQWLKPRNGKPGPMLACIELVLQTGLQDERFGQWFRKKVYEWATRPKNTGLPGDLDKVLIKLCALVIAPAYPGQALVRLHHLARRDNADVAQQASDQIIKLAEEPFFFRRALYRLTDGLPWKANVQDANLFLRVADPRKLMSDKNRSQALVFDLGVRRQLVIGWRTVQAVVPISTWQRQAFTWLQTAADNQLCTSLLDVLVESCDRHTTSLSRLHGLSLRWVRDSEGAEHRRRSRTATELADLIDACQDLEFLTDTGE